MLELQSKLLGNRVYFIRFCLSKDDVNKLIREYETKTNYSFGENEGTEWAITDSFEHGLFVEELKKHNIKGIGPLKFRYMSDLAYDKPLIGVCRFVKYDEAFDVDYPVSVNPNINLAIDKSNTELDDLFEYVLLSRGLYYEEASRVVNRNAKVDYELRYVSGDQVIEVIKNQHFDMLEDDDIDSSILIGAKIGDFVVLEDDNVTIGAVHRYRDDGAHQPGIRIDTVPAEQGEQEVPIRHDFQERTGEGIFRGHPVACGLRPDQQIIQPLLPAAAAERQ